MSRWRESYIGIFDSSTNIKGCHIISVHDLVYVNMISEKKEAKNYSIIIIIMTLLNNAKIIILSLFLPLTS